MAQPVTITIVLNVKPEVLQPFSASLRDMLKDTKKFPGFRSLRIMGHKADPNQLIFIEEWDSEEDYGKYYAWRTERGDIEAMIGNLAAEPKFEVWPTLVAN